MRANAIPEDGIHGPALANGDTLRFGKAGNAFVFQLDPADPKTSRSKRSEISFEPNLEPNKVYWIAFSVYLDDWGRLDREDAALFGTQVHSGDNSLNLSPAFSLYTTGDGRRFKVQARWSTAPRLTGTARSPRTTPSAICRSAAGSTSCSASS